jgi:DNA (cytosine-5)-methyltransferase 1
MRVLNLYAGIGGNRKLWEGVEVTAVEIKPDIAAVYKSHFPNDTVIVEDAHQYLLDNYKNFDFVWSSFPCQTHTRMRVCFQSPCYPDLGLYQEIIFLQSFFKGKYCVENVIPHYEPLIPAQQMHRHLFWCNFKIRTTGKGNPPKQIANAVAQNTQKKVTRAKKYYGDINSIKNNQPRFGFDLSGIDLGSRKDQVLRNCVDPQIGLDILNCARNIIKSELHQIQMF